jgi:hypothetical protein
VAAALPERCGAYGRKKQGDGNMSTSSSNGHSNFVQTTPLEAAFTHFAIDVKPKEVII